MRIDRAALVVDGLALGLPLAGAPSFGPELGHHRLVNIERRLHMAKHIAGMAICPLPIRSERSQRTSGQRDASSVSAQSG